MARAKAGREACTRSLHPSTEFILSDGEGFGMKGLLSFRFGGAKASAMAAVGLPDGRQG